MTQLRMKAKMMKTSLGATPGVCDLIASMMGWMQRAVAKMLMMVITVV